MDTVRGRAKERRMSGFPTTTPGPGAVSYRKADPGIIVP